MCGIVGGIGANAPTQVLLDSQLKSIEHRGPDDRGFFLANGISLGMCRLAIVEIAFGKQPATDETNKIIVVWNGEIYNYQELRAELESRGRRFSDSSESQVLINLYLEYGTSFVEKINGMFAIAIYDSRDYSLHLIRDRVGEKPLWYSHLDDGTLFFASEVRALLLARPDRTLRIEMIPEVMQYGYINAPNSAFKEIYQLPPASIMSWRDGKTKIRNYWSLNFSLKSEVTYVEALETTKQLIEEAVVRRLISERPIGAFLSGGYDSTIVASYMAKHMKGDFHTYTIGFQSSEFNEAHHAKRLADFLGTNHHEEILIPDANLIVEKIPQLLDQPFADSSFIPTYLLAKFAQESSIVALGGDGGDEVFGGYDRYLVTPILHQMNPILSPIQKSLRIMRKQGFGKSRRIDRLINQLERKSSVGEHYNSIVSLVQSAELTSILKKDVYSNSSELLYLQDFNYGDISVIDRMLRSDFSSYLPGDLLVKSDRATMAASMELRSPFLDVKVVEWGVSLPKKYKINQLETKRILKDVARSLVPQKLIDRPKKGFGIPRAEWLRLELRSLVFDLLTDTTAIQRGWFNQNEVQSVINRHMMGEDLDRILWPMLMLELWARNWLD
jgi:asparagine synthase (glutamine-hydrolysing)